jgi:hypothetical protein
MRRRSPNIGRARLSQSVTMNRHRALALGVLAVVIAGCTREIQSQDASTTTSLAIGAPTSTTSAATTEAATTTPPTVATTTAAPTTPTTPAPTAPTTSPTTIPVVSSDIVGVAVAGNSGGIGADQTDSFSEAIRNEDGTCSGWAGRDVTPPWTQGLESGAPFFILARDSGTILGEGTLGTSSFVNVGVDNEQWLCLFPFAATIDGNPQEFMIKVANLDPWLVRSDPSQPGSFVSSVNTVASAEKIPECATPSTNPISAWDSVGQYWSNGLRSLCSAGLTIADIERPCRGPREGSDYVVKVVSASDPNVVYEDDRGLQVDPATLPPGTPVVVLIATGRPCG